MRVVIHIGPKKTGTTYLQTMLFALRDRLLADGILYHTAVDGAVMGAPNRSNIAEAVLGGGVAGIARDLAAARDAGMRVVVVSNEVLSGLRPLHIQALRTAIGAAEVEIVYYCRRWSERLPAQWAQHVVGGLAQGFPDWYRRQIARGMASVQYNPALLWGHWADVFGRSSIRLVSYDALRAQRVDMAGHFLRHVLGWHGDMAVDAAHIRPHARLPGIEIEVLRALNALAAARGARFHHKPRMAVIYALRGQDMEPFRSLAARMHIVTIDDGGPDFAPAMAAMEAWQDCLASGSIDARLIVKQVLEVGFPDPAYLDLPAADAALQDCYVAMETAAAGHRIVRRSLRRHRPRAGRPRP